MTKVAKSLLLALMLLHTGNVLADEAHEEQDSSEVLSGVATAAIAIAAVGSALYASRGYMPKALENVRSLAWQLPVTRATTGFSKKTLAFTSVAFFSLGLVSTTLVALFAFAKYHMLPSDQALQRLAMVANKMEKPQHAQILATFGISLRDCATRGDELGEIARFMIKHLSFFYVPLPESGGKKSHKPQQNRPGPRLIGASVTEIS